MIPFFWNSWKDPNNDFRQKLKLTAVPTLLKYGTVSICQPLCCGYDVAKAQVVLDSCLKYLTSSIITLLFRVHQKHKLVPIPLPVPVNY